MFLRRERDVWDQLQQQKDLLMKGALAEAVKVAEASRVEALAWKEKAEGESY